MFKRKTRILEQTQFAKKVTIKILGVNIIDPYYSCTNSFYDENHQMWKSFTSWHELVSCQESKEQNNFLNTGWTANIVIVANRVSLD